VVVPQPDSAAATTRAAAALIQRLLFFKIPYLDGKRGMCRGNWHFVGYCVLLSLEQGCRFLMVASSLQPGIQKYIDLKIARGHDRSLNDLNETT
jgi:hypothetical protein